MNMYKLYILVLCKKNKSFLKIENRRTHIGFFKNLAAAKAKTEKILPDYKGIQYNEISLFDCLYLLPFMPDKNYYE